jgi:hypothetical protein
MIDEIRFQRAKRELEEALQDQTVRKDIDLLMATDGKTRQSQHRERMKAEGYKQVTVWLSKKSLRKLTKLTKKGGNNSEVINKAIDQYHE